MRRSIPWIFALSLATLSCREMPVDPWTAELPDGSVQLLPEAERDSAFSRATRNLPRRNDMTEPSQFVVRTQAEWTELWTKLRAPGQAPFVDFATEMVIGAAIGLVAPPWEQVFIAAVMANGTQLYVLVLRDGSNPECAPASGFDGSPVALVLVPRMPGTPKFLERYQQIPRCPGSR